MASETKAATSRRNCSTEPEVAASKTIKKTVSKSASPAKTAAKAPSKTVAKTPVKSATKKVAAPAKADKPAAKKTTTPRKTKATGQPITADARLRHIELAAYYIAEKSGFSRNPSECWTAAESEVDSLLLAGKLSA